ncbi:hypothetical protein RHMOL_Rhmol10G0131600 [Rhododendron molle]|uniref:Uncharacterized protein n=1 Tax=Rhododendron molle TaxID=49168 RepID=A0ACC0M1V3_RHOML|nr:hypothetical protein RHMOL_Rhmol10G0131600 [Rhododendron molle]
MELMTVTFPPSLMFLMLNFHNFVTIKLDSTNYMLWRIQVENIVSANGFYEYLDGSVECPERHIGNDEGNLIPNTAYTMFKEYAQKLVAGSPVDEDDLIFHTLRGLPDVFNGLKTTIRAMQLVVRISLSMR